MFKVINNGKLPIRATKYSACVDLYSNTDVVIGAGETVKIPLGVAIDIETFWKKVSFFTKLFNLFSLSFFMNRHVLKLEPRSSLRARGLSAGTGIIDLDFKDEIMIILYNPLISPYETDIKFGAYKIKEGDKIAQIMLCEHKSYLFDIESEEERKGGFGSSGN